MSFRRAAKKDTNQTQIVDELRNMGFRVDIVSQLKKLYDIVVTGLYDHIEPRTVRVEIKNGKGKLTDDESEYHQNEPFPETLIIARSTEDILTWFRWTKPNLYADAVLPVNVVVAKKDMTPITHLSTTSGRKGKRNTRSSTIPVT